jgi:hypothetical protein
VTAGQWAEAFVGFVIPTATVVWGIWILWRSYRPRMQPGGFVPGVVGFVLTCLLVILIVTGWELFKTWRPSARRARPPAASILPGGGPAGSGVA